MLLTEAALFASLSAIHLSRLFYPSRGKANPISNRSGQAWLRRFPSWRRTFRNGLTTLIMIYHTRRTLADRPKASLSATISPAPPQPESHHVRGTSNTMSTAVGAPSCLEIVRSAHSPSFLVVISPTVSALIVAAMGFGCTIGYVR